MAKIKIREGSCEIWHEGKPEKKQNDTSHTKGHAIEIHFMGTNQHYWFKKGVLVKMTSRSAPK